jgi:hypothetical protein
LLSLLKGLSGNDRQDQAGAPVAGMKYRLMGDAQLRIGPIVVTGVVIAVEIREVGARHGEADALAGLEQDAGRIELDRVEVRLARLDQRLGLSKPSR